MHSPLSTGKLRPLHNAERMSQGVPPRVLSGLCFHPNSCYAALHHAGQRPACCAGLALGHAMHRAGGACNAMAGAVRTVSEQEGTGSPVGGAACKA